MRSGDIPQVRQLPCVAPAEDGVDEELLLRHIQPALDHALDLGPRC
jgi:hypothetical protein